MLTPPFRLHSRCFVCEYIITSADLQKTVNCLDIISSTCLPFSHPFLSFVKAMSFTLFISVYALAIETDLCLFCGSEHSISYVFTEKFNRLINGIAVFTPSMVSFRSMTIFLFSPGSYGRLSCMFLTDESLS